jgi:RsiW-degrading membrane proteinase PrsW (M82 family)
MTLPDSNPHPGQPIPPETAPALTQQKRDTTGILLFIFNIIAIMMMLGGAAFMLLTILIQQIRPIPGMNTTTTLSAILLAVGLMFCGALLIPPMVQSARQMNRKSDLPLVNQPVRAVTLAALLVLWILVAGGAQLFDKYMNWFFLSPFLILGVGLPIYILFRLATSGLPVDSRQRAWNVFGLGLVAGPTLAAIAELGVYLLLLIGGSIFLAVNPEWTSIYTRIAAQLENAPNMEKILTVVGPYLTSPAAILVMLLVVSVAIPIIEELVKPVGVWLLRKRPPTPQEGFVLGVLSGAGFALLESTIALTSNDGSWGVAYLARVGGGIMHMMNTGLMGWAIASYWHDRKFLRLAGVYGLVILTHGLWNAMTVLIVVGGLRVALASAGTDVLGTAMTLVSMLGLVALAIAGLVTLIMLNRRMRKSIPTLNPPPAQSDIIAPLSQ